MGVGAGAGGAVERSVVGAGCALQSAAAASADPAAPDTRHSGRHVSGGGWLVMVEGGDKSATRVGKINTSGMLRKRNGRG